MDKIINHYSDYIKSRYHERVQKITVHGSSTCPNRDGTVGFGGCTFCNNEAFAAPTFLQNQSITDQINHGISKSRFRYKNVNKYIIYFQSYTNTHGDSSQLIAKFQEALNHPQVVGLSIGTRPDCMNLEILNFLAQQSKKFEITLELGLESFEDETLLRINRGHNVQAFYDAVKLCDQLGLDLCIHLIIGFPWEAKEQAKIAAIKLSKLPIKFLKLHQLHIVKNTQLEKEYLANSFKLIEMPEYIEQVATFLTYLSPNIILQRVHGEASSNLLVAPKWAYDMSDFPKKLSEYMEKNHLYQGKEFKLQ